MEEALRIAKSVLDFCPGDAWERECTEKDRKRFDELFEELFPSPKPKDEIFYCHDCERRFELKGGYKSHLASEKHRRQIRLNASFEAFSKTCPNYYEEYGTCKLNTSLFCDRKNCRQTHLWANT